MPFYNAGVFSILGATGENLVNLERLQSFNLQTELKRIDNSYINRFDPVRKPLNIYSTINCQLEYTKSDKNIEYNIGLLSGASVLSNLLDSTNLGFGLRNYNINISDNFNLNGSGALIQLKSGVLTNYSINATIDDIIKSSIEIEALDMSFSTNPLINDLNITGAKIIRSYDLTLTQMSLTGIGLPELSLQNFSLSLPLNRSNNLFLGDYYPKSRNLISPIVAKISLNGFVESISTLLNIKNFDHGSYYAGNIVITMTQSCANPSITTTFTIQNPYINSFSYNSSVGQYFSFNLDMEVPIALNSENNRSSVIIV